MTEKENASATNGGYGQKPFALKRNISQLFCSVSVMIYRGAHGCTNDSSAEPLSNAGGLEFFDVNS